MSALLALLHKPLKTTSAPRITNLEIILTFMTDLRYEAPTDLNSLPAGTAVEYDWPDCVGHHHACGMMNFVTSVLVPRRPYAPTLAGFYNFPCFSSLAYPTTINKLVKSSRLTPC